MSADPLHITIGDICTGPQEQITQSVLCISTTGSNNLERNDTKFELIWRCPPFA